MKRIILFNSCLFILLNSHAQEIERIETDRPNETEIPATVPRKYFQAEAGIYGERTSSTTDMISHPAALFKYGVSNHAELRLYTKLTSMVEHLASKDMVTTGLEPIEVGVKVAILESRKWIPHTSLVFQTGLATIASGAFKAEHLSPKLRVLMENKITESFSIIYNVGAEWDGSDTEPAWLYTFSPGVDIGRKWHVFAETFSFIKRNESPENTIDGGMEYFVNKDFTVDFCSGFGINKAAPHYFVTVGGSVRFK